LAPRRRHRAPIAVETAPPAIRSLAAAGPALVLFFVLASRFYQHTVDDAFITFRYARNLAAGLGPVYNAGERVEGYTNFLWMVLVAAGFKLGIDPLTTARWLGILAAVITIVGCAFLGGKIREGSWTLWIAPVFLAVHPAMTVWATGGLEAPLFACLVTWGVGLAAFEAETGTLYPRSAVLLALAALTRPEGVLFAGLVVASSLLFGLNPRPSLRRVAIWVAVFAAIWLPYFLWRWSYYGYPLPNTFYAKVDPGGSQVARGFQYLQSFAKATGYWLLLPMSGLLFVPARTSIRILMSVTAGYVAYTVFIGGDGLPMYRFFVPSLALIFVLVGWGTAGWLKRLSAGRGVSLAAAACLLAALVWTASPNFAGPDYDYVQQDIREVATWKDIGLWFKQHAAEGESIAVLPAGAMPYYSELKAIDMLGLNDVTIAHTPVAMGTGQAGHEKFNTEYVIRRAPTYVIVGVYGLTSRLTAPLDMIQPYYPLEYSLLNTEQFARRYHPHVGQTASGGYFAYFKRTD
jgi:hypothetical protein